MGVESQAQGPCFEKGLFLGHRPRIGGRGVGCFAQDSSEAWGQIVPEIALGLGLVGKLCPGTPSRPCLEGCYVHRPPSGREESGWRLVRDRLQQALASSGGCVPNPSSKPCLGSYTENLSPVLDFSEAEFCVRDPYLQGLGKGGPMSPKLWVSGGLFVDSHPGPPSPALAPSPSGRRGRLPPPRHISSGAAPLPETHSPALLTLAAALRDIQGPGAPASRGPRQARIPECCWCCCCGGGGSSVRR